MLKLPPIPLKYLISHTDPIVSSPVCYSSARATFHTHISITMQTQVKLQPQVSNKITIHIFYSLSSTSLLMTNVLFYGLFEVQSQQNCYVHATDLYMQPPHITSQPPHSPTCRVLPVQQHQALFLHRKFCNGESVDMDLLLLKCGSCT